MMNKGRRADLSKENHGMAKIKNSDAERVRLEYTTIKNKSEISRKLGIARSTVTRILLNQSWK
jgi:DNA-binding transcriptional regulator LsrR (DeoR family)